jgi:hypothetical protein
MNLSGLNNKITELLSDFQYKDLPNLPNLNGLIESSDITSAIISGNRIDRDIINVKINISVSATFRTNPIKDICNYTDKEQKNLYSLIYAVVHKLQKRGVDGGGTLTLSSFENYTPESGKWRSLITFEVPMAIDSEIDENDNCI